MIYITGDMHGEFSRFKNKKIKKLKENDTLIICGDFGFIWDGSRHENSVLNKIGNMPFNVAFIDGCHENFELLSEYEVIDWNGGKAQLISGNLVHLMGRFILLKVKKFLHSEEDTVRITIIAKCITGGFRNSLHMKK